MQINFSGPFAHIAHRFLGTNMPGTAITWETGLAAANHAGFAEEGLKLIEDFLESPVRGVTGWTWGDSIEESEDNGVEVDFADLPIGEYINRRMLEQTLS